MSVFVSDRFPTLELSVYLTETGVGADIQFTETWSGGHRKLTVSPMLLLKATESAAHPQLFEYHSNLAYENFGRRATAIALLFTDLLTQNHRVTSDIKKHPALRSIPKEQRSELRETLIAMLTYTLGAALLRRAARQQSAAA